MRVAGVVGGGLCDPSRPVHLYSWLCRVAGKEPTSRSTYCCCVWWWAQAREREKKRATAEEMAEGGADATKEV